MEKLELAWRTYEFHTSELYSLESDHRKFMIHYEKFLNKSQKLNYPQKSFIKKRAIKSFSRILNAYMKQINAISELVDLHLSGIKIPDSRSCNVQDLMSLLNVTATLVEEMKKQKKEICDFLN
jgi:hypothetical protein